MFYSIKNDCFKVEVCDIGAELAAIHSVKTDTEYLWQGNPEFWTNRATVCFPICGRLFEGKYTYEGKTYELPLHGIVRNMLFDVEKQTESEIVLVTKACNKSKTFYPFSFIFKATYSLKGNTLVNKFEIINTDDKVMPFSIGGHPGFNVPFTPEEKFEDYYLEFPYEKEVKRIQTSPRIFYTGVDKPYPLKDGKIIELDHELFDNDAIFLTDMCNEVTLKSKKSDRSITVSFSDMTHLGFWQKYGKNTPFLCIEPWHGIPSIDGKIDDLSTKLEMIRLEPGKTYTARFDITVKE